MSPRCSAKSPHMGYRLIVLAFLPYVNKESDSKSKQAEMTGNLVGAALAAVSFVNFAFLILEIVD